MMDVGSFPISITTQVGNGPVSPRQQTSNLTSALQSTTGNEVRPSPSINVGGSTGKGGRHDSLGVSISGLTPQYGGSGAQPISMTGSSRSRQRRESIAGSMAGGMSWGGVSVGSWIRDDIMMHGTSPFPYQSPSFHSSSYLPKMEANFMKDFSCCDMTLPTLHDLLQHYEEAHAQQVPDPMPLHYSTQQSTNPPDTRAAIATAAATSLQQQARLSQSQSVLEPVNGQRSSNTTGLPRSAQQHPHFRSGEFTKTPLQPVQDMDSMDDMEMDDITGINIGTEYPSNLQAQAPFRTQDGPPMLPRSQFGQSVSNRVAPLDLNALNFANPLQMHQGLRQSQPSTPISGGRPGSMYQHNPTVSSVNTPTLSAHPLQQQFRRSPESSAPGTPRELDPDFLGNLDSMSMDHAQKFMPQQQDFGGFGFGNGNEMLDLCIDEPAKRLFRANAGSTNQQQAQSRLGGNAQYGADSDIARRIREQQVKVGLADTVSGLNGEEPKPFRCPVIGCEKAYKNQNGLKYHKTHGHNNQQLHENADGTFSIVDPTTLSPYPGTLGMEKEKPYKCEVCGKRYKNLNGLKYHKSHSPACDPDLRLPAANPIAGNGMNVNTAGFGLTGLNEEMAS